MRGLVRDVLDDMIHRRILYVFGAITLFAVLITIGTSFMECRFDINTVGMSDLSATLRNPILTGCDMYMSVLVFLVVMATAGSIPSMFVKGRADYYLSKPISRTRLLFARSFGIWLIYGIVITASLLTCYFAACISFGFFDFRIIYVVIINLLLFFIWLSVTILAGIVTGSTALSVMAAFIVWVVQKFLSWHDVIGRIIDSKVLKTIIDLMYYVFPKPGDVSDMTGQIIAGRVDSWMPLYSSLLFAIAMFTLALYLFGKKDY